MPFPHGVRSPSENFGSAAVSVHVVLWLKIAEIVLQIDVKLDNHFRYFKANFQLISSKHLKL